MVRTCRKNVRRKNCEDGGSGIYNQKDATNSQTLLLAVLYMFREFFAHHQEPGTVCVAIRWCYIVFVCTMLQYTTQIHKS
jgi:hypothetical protein